MRINWDKLYLYSNVLWLRVFVCGSVRVCVCVLVNRNIFNRHRHLIWPICSRNGNDRCTTWLWTFIYLLFFFGCFPHSMFSALYCFSYQRTGCCEMLFIEIRMCYGVCMLLCIIKNHCQLTNAACKTHPNCDGTKFLFESVTVNSYIHTDTGRSGEGECARWESSSTACVERNCYFLKMLDGEITTASTRKVLKVEFSRKLEMTLFRQKHFFSPSVSHEWMVCVSIGSQTLIPSHIHTLMRTLRIYIKPEFSFNVILLCSDCIKCRKHRIHTHLFFFVSAHKNAFNINYVV